LAEDMLDLSLISIGHNYLSKEYADFLGLASMFGYTDYLPYFDIKKMRRIMDYVSLFPFKDPSKKREILRAYMVDIEEKSSQIDIEYRKAFDSAEKTGGLFSSLFFFFALFLFFFGSPVNELHLA
jgi:hypothetical protein